MKNIAALVAIPWFLLISSFGSAVESNKETDYTKPLKVFIMMGQSNMMGFGRIRGKGPGTLESVVREGRYGHLVDKYGNWTVRNDVINVWKNTIDKDLSSYLQVGGRHQTNSFGPELQFGHVLGNVLDSPVLILKVGTGNRALGWDFRPPGTLQYIYNTDTYAGYGECPSKWSLDANKAPDDCSTTLDFGVKLDNLWWPNKDTCLGCGAPRWYAGLQYDKDLQSANQVLGNLSHYVPNYSGMYEIAGFAFWQGYRDIQDRGHAMKYEENLVEYIRKLRHDYRVHPGGRSAKFVLATIAFDGCDNRMWDRNARKIFRAQMAVSGERYADFVGNVKTVNARTFWRDASISPCSDASHYNCNAETYLQVGNALGWAMADLIQSKEHWQEHNCSVVDARPSSRT